ncbi:MAG: hypothetical protein R3B91_01840 [Planctomycetaceae bacterium]
MSRTLFTGVRVLDCTGAEPFLGEVLVEGIGFNRSPPEMIACLVTTATSSTGAVPKL